MKKLILIILLSTYIQNISAQSSQGVALNLGYSYINTNAGYIGGEYAYRIDPSSWHGITIGIGTYYGSFNHNFRFIPEAHITYSNAFFLGEFSATPDNLNPSIGFNLLNMIRIKGGYSWDIGNNNRGMKGITFGLNFLLGTNGFYDEWGCPPPSYRALEP